MKRCIVCGSECDDASRVCDICGNPFRTGQDELVAASKIPGIVQTEDADTEESREDRSGEEDEMNPECVQEENGTVPKEEPAGASGEPERVPAGGARQGRAVVRGAKPAGAFEEPEGTAAGGARQGRAVVRGAKPVGAFEEPEEARQEKEAELAGFRNEPEETAGGGVYQEEEAVPKAEPADFGTAREDAADEWPESLFPMQKAAGREAPAVVREQSGGAPAESKGGRPEAGPENRPGRMKSGPHIYGQAEEPAGAYQGAQGVIRREVKGGHQAAAEMRNGVSGQGAPGMVPAAAPGEENARGTVRLRSGSRAQEESRAAAGGMQSGNARNMQYENARPGRSAASGRGGNPVPNAGTGRGAFQGRPVNGQGVPPAYRNPGMPAGRHSPEHTLAARTAAASRKLLASPFFLVITLLQTIYTVSSVAAVFLHQLSYSQVARLLAAADLPAQMGSYVNSAESLLTRLDSGAVAVNLAIRIPDILFCFGLWLIWLLAHSKKERMSGAGFVVLKIVVIVNMIISCAVLLLVLILAVTLVIATWGAGTKSMATAAAVALAAAVIVTMAVIMYYFCYLSTLRVCRKNAASGEVCGKVSGYVAFLHILIALPSVITILSGVINLEITGITGGIGRLGWMFLFGIWIFRYRGRMKEYNVNA